MERYILDFHGFYIVNFCKVLRKMKIKLIKYVVKVIQIIPVAVTFVIVCN